MKRTATLAAVGIILIAVASLMERTPLKDYGWWEVSGDFPRFDGGSRGSRRTDGKWFIGGRSVQDRY